MNNNTPKIVGISDAGTCDCCGRADLRRTVALSFNGDIRHYGRTCAAKATRTTSSHVGLVVKAIEWRQAYIQQDQAKLPEYRRLLQAGLECYREQIARTETQINRWMAEIASGSFPEFGR